MLIFLMAEIIFAATGTNAYFTDTERSVGDSITAGTLDIRLDDVENYSSGPITVGGSASVGISILNIGSLNSQYLVESVPVGGDTEACDHLTMTATTPTSLYVGLMKDFISVATSTTGAGWNFDFAVSPDVPPGVLGKTCDFKWVFTAWQDNLTDSSKGFRSIRAKSGSVTIGDDVEFREIEVRDTLLDPVDFGATKSEEEPIGSDDLVTIVEDVILTEQIGTTTERVIENPSAATTTDGL